MLSVPEFSIYLGKISSAILVLTALTLEWTFGYQFEEMVWFCSGT